ncbi:MAG: DUF4863 family protein [Rhodospirillales bacterium]|nr:DUF4863 family protein [Rhodospirillales bacterium]
MTPQQFRPLVQPLLDACAGATIDHHLAARLENAFPPDGDAFRAVAEACRQAVAEGWMCSQGEGNRRFGRIIEPAADTHDLSVDVVDLTEVVGPLHRHPTGEICMVMPLTEGARFDGKGAGWKCYKPGSAHRPTVSGGRALVLYMLPEGKIEFS